MVPWNSAKAKVQLRLSVQRLRTLQQKKEAQAKVARREIATLVEKGKVEAAKIRVESLIHEDIHLELLEILELYCELLLARFGLLDQNTREPDPGIKESVCSIIHAAPRTEVKELYILRDILMHKYGREFTIDVMENKDGCVSDRVVRKLNLETPSSELVDGYLTEITKAYGVEWISQARKGEEAIVKIARENDQDHDPKPSVTPSEASEGAPPQYENTVKMVSTSSPEKDDSKPGDRKNVESANAKESQIPSKKQGADDEFDALAKRFAALKKR